MLEYVGRERERGKERELSAWECGEVCRRERNGSKKGVNEVMGDDVV